MCREYFRAKFGCLILLTAVGFVFLGCTKNEEPRKIDFSKVEVIKPENDESISDSNSIKIAVSAMISPKETFITYKEILDYIGKKLGRTVKLVQKQTYVEVNDLMEKGEIDAAFVCSGPYVQGKKKFGMELLAVPVIHGEAVYYSYIIAHKDSPIHNFLEFKGRSFAFTDPNSNTGCLVPRYELAKEGLTPELFFRSYVFTKSHDNSVKVVAQKIVDGAAVDNLIWEYMNNKDPEFTSQTKIIAKLGPFGAPPVAAGPAVSRELKEKIQQILLNMHEDNEGKAILAQIFIDKFVVVDDRHYDSVRVMQEWLDVNLK